MVRFETTIDGIRAGGLLAALFYRRETSGTPLNDDCSSAPSAYNLSGSSTNPISLTGGPACDVFSFFSASLPLPSLPRPLLSRSSVSTIAGPERNRRRGFIAAGRNCSLAIVTRRAPASGSAVLRTVMEEPTTAQAIPLPRTSSSTFEPSVPGRGAASSPQAVLF